MNTREITQRHRNEAIEWRCGTARAMELLQYMDVNGGYVEDEFYFPDSCAGDYHGGSSNLAFAKLICRELPRFFKMGYGGYGSSWAALDLDVMRKARKSSIDKIIEFLKHHSDDPYEELLMISDEMEESWKAARWKEDAYDDFRRHLKLDEVDDSKECRLLKKLVKGTSHWEWDDDGGEGPCKVEGIGAWIDTSELRLTKEVLQLAVSPTKEKIVEALASTEGPVRIFARDLLEGKSPEEALMLMASNRR